MPELRPYQLAACDAAEAGDRVLLVAPTGAGKTIIAAELARRARARGESVCVYVHRVEIAAQTRAKLASAGAEGVEVRSLQREDDSAWDLAIFDEAHHLGAESWGAHALRAHKRSVGLTATPCRADGRAISGFASLHVVASYSELIAGGHLVPCSVVAPPRGSTEVGDPVRAHHVYGEGRRALIYCLDAALAIAVADSVGGAVILGDTPADIRAERVQLYREGLLSCLVSVHVLTEGFDVPDAEVAIVARGCQSLGTWLQIAGRVLRPAPGKASGLVVDCAGAVWRHGLPTEDREWTLKGKTGKRAHRLKLRQCLSCGGVSDKPKDSECPYCGEPYPKVVRARAVSNVELREVKYVESGPAKFAHLARLCAIANSRGYKPGWIGYQFKSKHGYWPSPREIASAMRANAGI